MTLGAIASQAFGDESARLSGDGAISNVAAALASVPAEGKLLRIARGDARVPPGGHLQGIQVRFDAAGKRNLAFLSHDSLSVAYLVIAELPANLDGDGRVVHVHEFPSDGQSPPLRHAGGIQILGNVLVVGLEDNQQKTRSEVQFWDVSTPEKPAPWKHLTIRRSGAPKDKTAGAVGLLRAKKTIYWSWPIGTAGRLTATSRTASRWPTQQVALTFTPAGRMPRRTKMPGNRIVHSARTRR